MFENNLAMYLLALKIILFKAPWICLFPFIMGHIKNKYKEKIGITFAMTNILILILSVFGLIVTDFVNVGFRAILIILAVMSLMFVWGLIRGNSRNAICLGIILHLIILLIALPIGFLVYVYTLGF